jgi:hypothetical protein
MEKKILQFFPKGMNEIVGPLYYVLAMDGDREWAEHAESDTFHCFQLVMAEVKDLFMCTLDGSVFGIGFFPKNNNKKMKKNLN